MEIELKKNVGLRWNKKVKKIDIQKKKEIRNIRNVNCKKLRNDTQNVVKKSNIITYNRLL